MGILIPLYLYLNYYSISRGQSQRKKPTELDFFAFLCILFHQPLNVVVSKTKTPISTPLYGKVAQKITSSFQRCFLAFFGSLHNFFSFIFKAFRLFLYFSFHHRLFLFFLLDSGCFLFTFNKNGLFIFFFSCQVFFRLKTSFFNVFVTEL